jgi:hypothetical protein
LTLWAGQQRSQLAVVLRQVLGNQEARGVVSREPLYRRINPAAAKAYSWMDTFAAAKSFAMRSDSGRTRQLPRGYRKFVFS